VWLTSLLRSDRGPVGLGAADESGGDSIEAIGRSSFACAQQGEV